MASPPPVCSPTICADRGGQVIPYVPDRIREGYSLNCATIAELAEQGVTLIITVDAGITNLEEIAMPAPWASM